MAASFSQLYSFPGVADFFKHPLLTNTYVVSKVLLLLTAHVSSVLPTVSQTTGALGEALGVNPQLLRKPPKTNQLSSPPPASSLKVPGSRLSYQAG